MSDEPTHDAGAQKPPRLKISLDWWAVITALALALLVFVGLVPAVPW